VMVGFEPTKKSLTRYELGIAGAVSGLATRLALQPLDVVKIRFQLQVEPLSRQANAKYWGIVQASRCILKEEGYSALWKGHVPAQILSIGYGIVQFLAFETFSELAWKITPLSTRSSWQPFAHFVCGGMAGTVATVVMQPLDVIRTRFVAQGNRKIYSSVWSAVCEIVHKERIHGLYRGLTPTLLAIGPQTGFQFGFYSVFSSTWKKCFGDSGGFCLSSTFLCGCAAGISSKIAVYPLDLTKKRLQIQGFSHGRKEYGRTEAYSGLKDCFKKIYLNEGILGFYKGLSPSLFKSALATGFHLMFYELLCDIFRQRP